jgi:hypothetical protein
MSPTSAPVPTPVPRLCRFLEVSSGKGGTKASKSLRASLRANLGVYALEREQVAQRPVWKRLGGSSGTVNYKPVYLWYHEAGAHFGMWTTSVEPKSGWVRER